MDKIAALEWADKVSSIKKYNRDTTAESIITLAAELRKSDAEVERLKEQYSNCALDLGATGSQLASSRKNVAKVCVRLANALADKEKAEAKAAEMERGWENCYYMWRSRAEAAEAEVEMLRIECAKQRHIILIDDKLQEIAALRAKCAAMEEVLYDGYAVLMGLTDAQKLHVSPEAVSAVLDSVVRIIREKGE